MTVERSRRFLVVLFGSAGDLLPLMRWAIHARERGHEVRMALPRSLSLYTRAYEIAFVPLGLGAEMRIFADPQVVTTRFDGWASWRRLLEGYVAPALPDAVRTLDDAVDRWRPDVVIAGSFAVDARVLAARHELPLLEFSIYPQHVRIAAARRARLARGLRAKVAELLETRSDDPRVTRAMWCARDAFVLNDPALLGETQVNGCHVVGFPSWDGPFVGNDAAQHVARWTGTSAGRPTVLVTAGSFIGARQSEGWTAIARGARRLGARVVLAGPRSDAHAAAVGESTDDVLAVGAAPLSTIVPYVDAVVHHGGIGTTFTALRAGRPAVAIAQAFDQPANGRLLERTGAGRSSTPADALDALDAILSDDTYAKAARHLAARLIPTDEVLARMTTEALARATTSEAH